MHFTTRVKLQRDRFLFLVTALAAGCGAFPNTPARDPAEGLDDPSRLGSGSEGYNPVPAATVPPPSVEGATTTSASVDADPNPYAPSKLVGQTCMASLNARGYPRSCAPLRAPSPTCEGGDDKGFRDTKNECEHISERLKPRVAEKAVDCVLAKSGTDEVCAPDLAITCAYEALSVACVERAATPVCKRAMEKCGASTSLTQASCEAAYSAMKESERKGFVTCMTEACDVAPCLEL
jgi:hypothetical protein